MSKGKRVYRRRLWLVTAAFVLLCAASVVWRMWPPATWNEPRAVSARDVLTVRFLDVGQGDCALLTVNDTAVLVDAGTVENPDLPRELLATYGVTRLNAVIISHPHADHIGGLAAVLQAVTVDEVIMLDTASDGKFYEKAVDAMAEKGVERVTPTVGEDVSVGELTFAVLGPLFTEAEDENDLSLCVRLDYGERSFLFCGDMTEEAETTLLQLSEGLSADVLKVAHHGSGHSSSRKFLQAVSPSVAVISCGLYNDYGHPHASALTRLNAVGAEIYRTDTQGTVTVVTDGESLSVSCEKSETSE